MAIENRKIRSLKFTSAESTTIGIKDFVILIKKQNIVMYMEWIALSREETD